MTISVVSWLQMDVALATNAENFRRTSTMSFGVKLSNSIQGPRPLLRAGLSFSCLEPSICRTV